MIKEAIALLGKREDLDDSMVEQVMGEIMTGEATDAQKAALLALVRKLKKKYPKAKVYGHCDFAAKACPCFNARLAYAVC